MRVKIEIDGSYLDLYNSIDEEFYITKQINDLRNLQNRQADYTRQFSIPKTPNNLNLLGMLTNEKFANNYIDCIIYIDNIQFLPASLLISDHNQTSLNVILFTGNFDLFELIPNADIKELDFSEYNFDWDITTLNTLTGETEGAIIGKAYMYSEETTNNGFEIPGNLSTSISDRIDINNFCFGFFLKTIFKKIISNSGYTLDETNLSSNSDYTDQVLICPVILPGFESTVLIGERENTGTYTYDETNAGVIDQMTFNSSVQTGISWTTDHYTLAADGEYRVIFTATVTTNIQIGPIEITIRNDGGYVDSLYFNSNVTDQDVKIDAVFTGVSGAEIYIEIQGGYISSSIFDQIDFAIGSNFTIRENVEDPTSGLIISDYLPEYNQRTFFIDFIKLFNGFISANSLTKTLNFKTWDQLRAETPQDISNNLDISKQITESETIGSYYINSEMNYYNDKDIKRTDINYTAIFDNDKFLQKNGIILTVGFSGSDMTATETIRIYGVNIKYRTAKSFNVTISTKSFTFTNEETFVGGEYIRYGSYINRIQYANSKTSGEFYNNAGATVSNTDVEIMSFEKQETLPRIAKLDSSGSIVANLCYNDYNSPTSVTMDKFQFKNTMNEIYTNYYFNMFNALRTAKIITAWFVFNPLEFIKIDMTKPVTVDGFNGTFYINKIEQYKLNAPCRVELIRINSFQ